MQSEISKHVERNLSSRHFLKYNNISKKEMQGILENNDWVITFDKLKNNEIINCKKIINCISPILNRITSEPEMGWEQYIIDLTIKQLFPEGVYEEENKENRICRSVILQTIRTFIEEKKFTVQNQEEIIVFLKPEEYESCNGKQEYDKLVKYWSRNYINEFMLIYGEKTSFNIIGHISGVHKVALIIGEQLRKVGVPLDIALMSGAAIGHDIGKFGCKETESARTPYLHYYYTDIFFKSNEMPIIGHIATNHSTWDLELENLSAESLVLIYSDFRVKGYRDSKGIEHICYYSLKDSFEVILKKLDNMDELKRIRYEKVYSKIRDFEEYMVGLGVSIDLTSKKIMPVEKKFDPLLNSNETIKRIKDLAIKHNIYLMKIFNDEIEFGDLLEAARSEKQWKKIRSYINIFYEYSNYMTQKQKLMTMNYLYELLMHREGDIRRLAAELMGILIVNFDEEFRKEIPKGVKEMGDDYSSLDLCDEYFNKIIFPEHKIADNHKRWIGYTLKIIIKAMLSRAKEEEKSKYLSLIIKYFTTSIIDDSTAFILLDSMLYLPLNICSDEQNDNLLGFCVSLIFRESEEIKIGILRVLEYFVRSLNNSYINEEIKQQIKVCIEAVGTKYISSIYLINRIYNMIGYDNEEGNKHWEILYGINESTSDIFLENLKVGTPWVIKAVNIEYLIDRLRIGRREEKLHIATHLSNLLKVSERVTVRHSAGAALPYVISLLSLDQRNEIVIELTRGLEIGEYQFSKYIPEYLGQIALFLHPNELDELIAQLGRLLESRNEKIASVTLNTIGVLLYKYPAYSDRFIEDEITYENRRETLTGLLLKGLANYNQVVSQEAFHVIGKYIYANIGLSFENKNIIFKLLFKKMLTLLTEQEESQLEFFNNAASLNHIYRFISEYSLKYGDFKIVELDKIAFFPGTFDPFSLSHKGIVKEIKKLGYEVYLSLDEFSWSKKTQPRKVRRRIITMSVADERNVYVIPDEIQVNLSNIVDLNHLRSLFIDKEIFIVVGSDVIANASSYKIEPKEGSIHSFNHIIFKRSSLVEGNIEFEEDYSAVNAKVIELKLPTHLEDISSSRIRENIDFNRDISNLIDAVAQNYIYDNSLYLREPQYKSIVLTKGIKIEKIDIFTPELISELSKTLLKGKRGLNETFLYLKRNDTIGIIIRDGEKKDEIVAMSAFSLVETVGLYQEFLNSRIAAHLREEGAGKRVLIGGIYYNNESSIRDVLQLLISETLADCLMFDFTYAIYHPHGYKDVSQFLLDTLERQGFTPLEEGLKDDVIYKVDMKFPVVLIQNMEARIKYPFNQNERILEVIDLAHKNLQSSAAKMYPNTLILSVNQEIIHHKLIGMITAINGVPKEPQQVRKLGELMCVPFGKILNGFAVPNTITKTLHTEKYFDSEIKRFKIKEYPNYSKLYNQVKTIKSFDRGVILVDDLLHKGYRIRELDPMLKAENIDVKKIVVGILSGRGKDLMTIQDRMVESAYFVPNLRVWFLESTMYPFIGGDSVEREGLPMHSGLINSINLIMPYVSPTFLNGVPREKVYDFSMECLKNAREILVALEEEYQELFQKNLTLNRLGEAILSPKCPDVGACMAYDYNLASSVFVVNDIEKLIRLKSTVL